MKTMRKWRVGVALAALWVGVIAGCDRTPDNPAAAAVTGWLEAERRGDRYDAAEYWDRYGPMKLSAVRDWEILRVGGNDDVFLVIVRIESSHPVLGTPIIQDYQIGYGEGLLRTGSVKR